MLQRLNITGVRNLQPCSLSLSRLNLFCGMNGSGKSSLLESVYLLALGRSFRSAQIRKVIQEGQQSCTVFSLLKNGQQLGISKDLSGGQVLKRNGAMVGSMAELAHDLPVQLIHPEGLDLIDGGSKQRRQLFDWLVFHVEPSFYKIWLRYQRALSQRNALLKIAMVDDAEWRVWEQEMALSALSLHQLRTVVINNWLFFVQNAMALLLPQLKVSIEYVAGFDIEKDYAVQLAESRFKDRERGHTQIGPHRADLRLKTDLGPVEAVLSRGQKKLLVCALKLAQVEYLKTQAKSCVVLLDDLASELDIIARARLLSHLWRLDAQVLITAVEADSVWPMLHELDNQAKLFHVEHGEIIPQTSAALAQ
jgi:DNA replication and repair protein RecF